MEIIHKVKDPQHKLGFFFLYTWLLAIIALDIKFLNEYSYTADERKTDLNSLATFLKPMKQHLVSERKQSKFGIRMSVDLDNFTKHLSVIYEFNSMKSPCKSVDTQQDD
jgi:hypothetical protein